MRKETETPGNGYLPARSDRCAGRVPASRVGRALDAAALEWIRLDGHFVAVAAALGFTVIFVTSHLTSIQVTNPQ